MDIKTVESLIYPYFCNGMKKKGHCFKPCTDNNISYQIISDGISNLSRKSPDMKILDQRNMFFLFQEICCIKDCMYLEEEEYQNVDRLGMVKYQMGSTFRRLAKNSETGKTVFELMLYHDRCMREAGFVIFPDIQIYALNEIRKSLMHTS